MKPLIILPLWVATALGLAAVGAVHAQPQIPAPDIVEPDQVISLAVGETKTLRFRDSFKEAGTVAKDIASITPQNDKTLTIGAISAGQTLLYVRGETNGQIYTATIIVAPTSGHLVKLYGHKAKDFISYYCSETGCGRADLDLKLANDGRDPDEPTSRSITVTQPTAGGGTVSTTSQYR